MNGQKVKLSSLYGEYLVTACCRNCKGLFPVLKTGQYGTQNLTIWHYLPDSEIPCNGSQSPPLNDTIQGP